MSLFSEILLCKYVYVDRTNGTSIVARPDMSTDIVVSGRNTEVIRFIPVDKRLNITYLMEEDIKDYKELVEDQLLDYVSAADLMVSQPNKKPFYEMPMDEQKFELMLASRNLSKTHR